MRVSKTAIFLLFFTIFFPCFFQIDLYSQEEPTTLQTTSPIVDLLFVTGREQGTYYPVGMTIKNIIAKEHPNIQILCEPSKGSIDNARLLVSDRAQLAIIQSDVAYYLCTGARIFSLPSDKIKGICSLYVEAVHVVAKRDSGIRVMQDLKGKIVSVGQRNSGSEFNTKIILDSLNISYQDITPIYETLNKSIELIKNDEIDAFFVTTKIPVLTLSQYFEDLDLELISFTSSEIEKIINAYPYFVLKKIGINTYPNQERDVVTLGVNALLVAHSFANKRKVFQITKAIFAHSSEIERNHPFISLKEETSSKIPIPHHPGAEQHYIELGIIKSTPLIYYFGLAFLVLVIIFAGVVFVNKYPEQSKIIYENIYVRFSVIFFVFVFLGSWGLYLSERNINENFSSVSQSLWSCIVYLFSGFEDRSPITSGGKVISVFIFLLGVSIFGIVSGKFASFFVDKALKKEKKMPMNMKGHIVVCNWNSRGEHIVKEIYNADQDRDITILTDIEVMNEKELHKRNEFKNVHFARGDPAIHDRLGACKIKQAESVIILANETSQDPDAQSALVALAISKVCKEEKPHMIAEALNHRKMQHLKDADVDEVVCASDYGTGLIAQAALNPGMTKVYDRLLSYSGDTNEVYVIKKENVPSTLKVSFAEASKEINEHRDPKNPVILLGVMRDGEPIINPKKSDSKIEDEDDLLVLSYHYPDLSHIK